MYVLIRDRNIIHMWRFVYLLIYGSPTVNTPKASEQNSETSQSRILENQ